MTRSLFPDFDPSQARATGEYSDEWYTPPEIIAALGGPQSFDLDPCAPITQMIPTARRTFTILDNGLLQNWGDRRVRVYLNPPYSPKPMHGFVARMVAHGHGVALLPFRPDTELLHQYVWNTCHAIFAFKGRIRFHTASGSSAAGRADHPSVLCAYGARDAEVLSALTDMGLKGKFVPLKLPRSVLVLFAAAQQSDPSWRELLVDLLSNREGWRLDEIYRAIAAHPKCRRNRHWQEKARQVLQHGPFQRVGRGQWRAA